MADQPVQGQGRLCEVRRNHVPVSYTHLDVYKRQDNIRDEFIGYISTLFHISDKDYAAQFAAALREEGAIAKGPYLDVSDSYKTGKSLAQMIEEGEASSLFHSLEGDIPDGEKEIQINRGLYLHQERALRKTNKGKNLIVTTGTGSGKTECFIIPIINHLLRERCVSETGTRLV